MKEKINITVDEEVIEAIRQEAKDNNRTLSNYIDTILKDYIEQSKKDTE